MRSVELSLGRGLRVIIVSAAAVAVILSACSSGSSPAPVGHVASSSKARSAGTWCAAKKVLQAECQSCHGAQPMFGAPMSLVSLDDLHAKAKSDGTRRVYELIPARIHDTQKPMPPLSVTKRPSAAELASLGDWIAAGAPSGADPTCGAGGAIHGGAAGSGPATGASGAGATADVKDEWPADCDARYTILAHGQSAPDDTSSFNVSAGGSEFYQCFFFNPPWGTDQVQGLKFRPVTDDARVLHHWILYALDSTSAKDGQVGGNGCANGSFLAGWAPGNQGSELPKDVGLEMPSAPSMLGMQFHYNNTAGYTDAMDRSGVELCVTHTPRTHAAGVHWLGSLAISVPAHQAQDVVSQCTPGNTEPVHIIGHSPHMHTIGVHAKLVVNRSAGGQTVIHDAPFDFAEQLAYPVEPEVLVMPGDTLTTTCGYNNTTDKTISFGEFTEQEMCFNFVMAWPAGGLASGSLAGGSAGGGIGTIRTRCMQ